MHHRILSNIISNTSRVLSLIHLEYYHITSLANTDRILSNNPVDSRFLRRGRWTPKEKEPSQDHSSGEIPEEPARYWRTWRPTQPCSDGRARPPPWHGDVPPPRGPAASAPIVAHATATKEAPGRRWEPGSSPSCAPRKVAPPSASPAEPSPGHGASQAGCRHRVDDEDAGRASSTPKMFLCKFNIF
jgi:hypothetical protein